MQYLQLSKSRQDYNTPITYCSDSPSVWCDIYLEMFKQVLLPFKHSNLQRTQCGNRFRMNLSYRAAHPSVRLTVITSENGCSICVAGPDSRLWCSGKTAHWRPETWVIHRPQCMPEPWGEISTVGVRIIDVQYDILFSQVHPQSHSESSPSVGRTHDSTVATPGMSSHLP